ncbi:MAG: hypothetical protein Q4D38_05160 [Planctomycetia bacterium]|nr:hypothetical protein [Planctomycetia bacterium]
MFDTDIVDLISEVSDVVKRYDIENESPFVISEFCHSRTKTSFIGECQMLIDWDNLRPSNGCGCAERRAAPSEVAESCECDILPPASNTGLVKYQYPTNWGGYDGGVEASIYGKWSDNFSFFCSQLDRCKKAADEKKLDESFVEFGGFLWLVKPTGAGSGFFKYKYVLESHGIKLYIHSSPRDGVIPVRVRFGFECLARTNLFDAVSCLRACLEDVGFFWDGEVLSRVDMQVLLPVDISEFLDAMKGNRVVTRCRGQFELHSSLSTWKVETVTFRSSSCELCIYDKRAHLIQSDAVYCDTFYRYVLHSSEMPESLTRVEFRFRREALKRYGINTFDQLRRCQVALPQLAGTDWFRILERDKVRGSEKEIPIAPIWKRTLDAFAHYFREVETSVDCDSGTDVDTLRTFRPVKDSVPAVRRLVLQAVGCLCSAASVSLEKVLDSSDVIRFCNSVLLDFGERLYYSTVQKQIINAVVHGFSPVGGPSFTEPCEIIEAMAPPTHVEFLEFS